MKRVNLTERSKQPLHIEAPGCVINIRTVADRHGNPITSIEIIANGNRYSGEAEWWIEGKPGDCARNMRIMQIPTA